MKAVLLAIGSGMPAWVETAYAEYARRLSHWLPLGLVELPPGERARGRSAQQAMQEEARRLEAACPRGARVVLLDGRGRAHSSEGLAERVQFWRMQGQDLCLMIGGPDGFAPELRERADEAWSLGPLTLPHPLVRVVVAEQLYRAASILANHPYHRGG
jgi:23S rRNA (pseudouridine1915-N3)-methyltransferase